MNWDALGTIAEIVSAVAILLTLIYLAVQIRQAKVATLGQIVQSRTSEFNVLTGTLVSNGNFADIWVKASNSEAITEAESLRLRGFILMLWNQVYAAYVQRKRGIIKPTRIVGAPDLVVEVASPSTQTHDRSRKLSAYAEAGVPECWLADPDAQTVELLVFNAEQKVYRSQGAFRGGAVLPSVVLSDFDVPVRQFFE